MLDKTTVRAIAIKYSNEVKSIINPEKIILFGSYVNGVPHQDSDIDIAVLVHDIDPEAFYESRILLQRIKRNKDYEDIEPHLLDENDDPSGFVEYILKTGEIIYQFEH